VRGVAKWCGRGRVAAEATAVGDDAALSVFTQLAGYERRRRGRNARKGESRTRITRSPETRRALRITTLYYYTKRTRGGWEVKGKIRRRVDRDRRSESRRSLTYIHDCCCCCCGRSRRQLVVYHFRYAGLNAHIILYI